MKISSANLAVSAQISRGLEVSKSVPNNVVKFIQSISEDELDFISQLDYGEASDKHLVALKQVIFEADCKLSNELDQSWYPYEVIELGSHVLKEGHEKEFTICTLLVLYAVITGYDISTDAHYNLECRASDYDKLPNEYSDFIVTAYREAIKKGE